MVHRRPATRIDPEVADAAAELTHRGYGPSAIQRDLNARFGERAPGLRWLKGLRASLRSDPSEPWRFAEAEPEEAAAVMPVLAAVIEETLGRTKLLTRDEAAHVRRIRIAAPDIEPWDAYRVARELLVADGAEADALVCYLAFAPWRDGGERYAKAYAVGAIDRLVYRYETPSEAARGAGGSQ